jgi:hypothetical protein
MPALENFEELLALLPEIRPDPQRWLLRNRLLPPETARFLVESVTLEPRAAKKFDSLYLDGMLFTRKAFEQASGSTAAFFKARLGQQNTVIDLCGGLGLDSLAFLKSGKRVFHNDTDALTRVLARHNHRLHKIHAEDYTAHFIEDRFPDSWPDNHDTLLYLDPDRRVDGNRAHALNQLSPNPIQLLEKTSWKHAFLIKLSPLFDTAEIRRLFPENSDIYVVSWQGENREVLVHFDSAFTSGKTIAVKLTGAQSAEIFSGEPDIPVTAQTIDAATKSTLLLPEVSLIHARLTGSWAQTNHLRTFGYRPAAFLGESKPEMCAYAGRILETGAFHIKTIASMLKKLHPDGLTFRFPDKLQPHEALRKSLNIPDGGSYSLIVSETVERKKIYAVCLDDI